MGCFKQPCLDLSCFTTPIPWIAESPAGPFRAPRPGAHRAQRPLARLIGQPQGHDKKWVKQCHVYRPPVITINICGIYIYINMCATPPPRTVIQICHCLNRCGWEPDIYSKYIYINHSRSCVVNMTLFYPLYIGEFQMVNWVHPI